MGGIKGKDEEYLRSGRWKCLDSPTGAHHSHEVDREGQYGYFLCKYCLNVQKLPITLNAAMRRSDTDPRDTVISPRI